MLVRRPLGILGGLWFFVCAPWGSFASPGGSLASPWGSFASLWGSLASPSGCFGGPRGSLGSSFGIPWGPLERLGCEGMRWETEMSLLLCKTKVLGIARDQHDIFA